MFGTFFQQPLIHFYSSQRKSFSSGETLTRVSPGRQVRRPREISVSRSDNAHISNIPPSLQRQVIKSYQSTCNTEVVETFLQRPPAVDFYSTGQKFHLAEKPWHGLVSPAHKGRHPTSGETQSVKFTLQIGYRFRIVLD